jgi:hypothetical protein
VYNRERAAECFGERESRLHLILAATFEPGGEQVESRLVDDVTQVSIPHGARQVVLWFRAVNGDGGISWDTQFGQNYRAPVDALT